MRYPAEIKAVVLTRLAVQSGHLTRRHFEAVEVATEIPAETVHSWAAAAGMVEIRRTGKRGRPPGPCGTPYQRQGADGISKIEGCKDLPESAYRLTAAEMERLDWFLAKREPLMWSQGFVVPMQFD